MDTKDCFLTQSYRGGYIHSCENRTTGKTEVKVQLRDGEKAVPAKSILAAKRLISRSLKLAHVLTI